MNEQTTCSHCYHNAHCGHSCVDDTCDHCTECACINCQIANAQSKESDV